MADKSVIIKIKRQNNPTSKSYWEEFELAWHPGMNVISSLMEIAANPVTRDGKETTPITYDSNCLEEVCGSCAMLINGRARMACSALIDNLEQPVKLEPFSKFPIVRDLATDRNVIFENLKVVKAWVPIGRNLQPGTGPTG
jgi:succinate dehydrogenase / fumarate reductase, iron-sulfur subunit